MKANRVHPGYDGVLRNVLCCNQKNHHHHHHHHHTVASCGLMLPSTEAMFAPNQSGSRYAKIPTPSPRLELFKGLDFSVWGLRFSAEGLGHRVQSGGV